MCEAVLCRNARVAKLMRKRIYELNRLNMDRFEREVAPLYRRAEAANDALSIWYWQKREQISKAAEAGEEREEERG